MALNDAPVYTKKDFMSDQVVRWCPGCGDYSILSQVQTVFAQIGEKREDIAVVSGIGCSSRFPYYVNTYGFHTIHGRAPAVASGLKVANPELSVWVVTGDGDGLSIGGNHFIHLLRRNLDMQVLLFNNRIYGLTKGQYSPTSEEGKRTKSSPMGSIDHPFVPAALALGADATFVARTADVLVKDMRQTLLAAEAHKGTSLVEIYQNCVIFNDQAFADLTDRKVRAERLIFVKHGEPLLYGVKGARKGLTLDRCTTLVSVDVSDEPTPEELEEKRILHHDQTNPVLAILIARLAPPFPVAMGVIFQIDRPTYDDEAWKQVETAKARPRGADLQRLVYGGDTWQVE